MKYIVGAGIGGLFGLSAPFMMETHNIINDNDSRQEESQLPDEDESAPIDHALILPDDFCGYIEYESTDPKEQAKECLKRSHIAIPSLQSIYYVDNIELKIGDIIIDASSGEIGLLTLRYDVLEYVPMVAPGLYNPDYVIWAWEILWTGPGSDQSNRYQPYTEDGLLNMICAGVFEHIPSL